MAPMSQWNRFKTRRFGKKWRRCAWRPRDWTWRKFALEIWGLEGAQRQFASPKRKRNWMLSWQWLPFSLGWRTKRTSYTRSASDMTSWTKCTRRPGIGSSPSRLQRNTIGSIWKTLTTRQPSCWKFQGILKRPLCSMKKAELIRKKYQGC